MGAVREERSCEEGERGRNKVNQKGKEEKQVVLSFIILELPVYVWVFVWPEFWRNRVQLSDLT